MALAISYHGGFDVDNVIGGAVRSEGVDRGVREDDGV